MMQTINKKTTEELIPLPIPALVAILVNKENEKGEPLTKEEVLEIRNNATCIMLPISEKLEMEKSRGYADLDPEYVWEQWQEFKLQ